jgi:hypothetical protein
MSVKISNVSRSLLFLQIVCVAVLNKKAKRLFLSLFSTIAWALLKIDLHEPETERSQPTKFGLYKSIERTVRTVRNEKSKEFIPFVKIMNQIAFCKNGKKGKDGPRNPRGL